MSMPTNTLNDHEKLEIARMTLVDGRRDATAESRAKGNTAMQSRKCCPDMAAAIPTRAPPDSLFEEAVLRVRNMRKIFDSNLKDSHTNSWNFSEFQCRM